jgi:hypothetical protein
MKFNAADGSAIVQCGVGLSTLFELRDARRDLIGGSSGCRAIIEVEWLQWG